VIAEASQPTTYQTLRPYLFSVAYRMTGSASDAEDLVQDAWMRYLDAGSPAVTSLRAYLTTIVSRLALDYLKSARVTREEYIGTWMPEPVLTSDVLDNPAATVEQRESVSLALLTMLEHLTPDQRVVYVLREGFGLPYDEIAGHIDKSAASCRQLFRRAQVRLTDLKIPARDVSSDHRHLIDRFMDAMFRGDADGVATLLADDVIWTADSGPNRLSNRGMIQGRDRVSRGLAGLTRKLRPEMEITTQMVDINGKPTVVIFAQGKLERAFAFDTSVDGITHIRILLNPEKLAYLAHSLATEPVWETPFKAPRGTTESHLLSSTRRHTENE